MLLPLSAFARTTFWVVLVLTGIAMLAVPMGSWIIVGAPPFISATCLIIDRNLRISGVGESPDPGGSRHQRVRKSIKATIITASLLFSTQAVLGIALDNPEVYEVVDVPEHPETFREEAYFTGRYEVIDDRISPCWIGQVWSDCINTYVAQYNGACANVDLQLFSISTCRNYSQMIDHMKSQDFPGAYVSTLGGAGSLTRHPEMSTREVSNNDYAPAVTHQAVCYLGFIGECR